MKRFRIICAGILLLGLLATSSLFASILDSDIRVSLTFDDTPIGAVLKMIAAQNNLNLVVSAEVTGDISISLNDVSLAAALDAILTPNGFNYYIKDDIIIVKTMDQEVIGELTAETYRLKYISATSAAEAVEPLLSDKGKFIPVGSSASEASSGTESNRLVIYDYAANHAIVRDLINAIDVKRRQISIEAKIIETNLQNEENLGINWPKSISASLSGVATPGTSTTDESTTGENLAVMPLEDGNWQLGYLSVAQMDVVLNFLQQRNNAKLLSNPRVTTLENDKAIIDIQTVIPIQTINRFSEGAVVQDIVTFQDEEIGISLEVTPRINDDSTITLTVHPVVEEIIGYSGPSDNQKPITSKRELNTNVTVSNKETLVLGGLLKETEIQVEDKLFLLGSIPVLGKLFTHKTSDVQTTDLLIMITPSIIE
ncbi:MAG: secretin N-terminal domain-containing protein [Candidatus Zixiibacteriota bacterium]